MAKKRSINGGKVLIGGLAAGLVMNVIDYLSNNFILSSDWQRVAQMRNIDNMAMAGTPALVTFVVVDFLFGLLVVFTYAAIRPRFGPGLGTAAIAAFMPFVATALVMATLAGIFFPWDLYIRASALALTSTLIGGIVGAKLYSEEEPEEEVPGS